MLEEEAKISFVHPTDKLTDRLRLPLLPAFFVDVAPRRGQPYAVAVFSVASTTSTGMKRSVHLLAFSRPRPLSAFRLSLRWKAAPLHLPTPSSCPATVASPSHSGTYIEVARTRWETDPLKSSPQNAAAVALSFRSTMRRWRGERWMLFCVAAIGR